jgi:hypothetical protein
VNGKTATARRNRKALSRLTFFLRRFSLPPLLSLLFVLPLLNDFTYHFLGKQSCRRVLIFIDNDSKIELGFIIVLFHEVAEANFIMCPDKRL